MALEYIMPAGQLVKVVSRSAGPRRRGLNRRQVGQVQKIINANKQLKQRFIGFQLNPTSTGVLTEFTSIGEGDDFFQRDSDSILVQSIRLQMCARANATPVAGIIRIMIVRGKHGPLAVADLPSSTVGAPDLDKMQVYHDGIICHQDVDYTLPFLYAYMKKFKTKKIPHLKVGYDDDVSATAAQDNPIYLFTISSSASGTGTLDGYLMTKFFNKN